MNYTEYTTALQQMLVMTDTYGQAMFNALIPTIITFAENMIYRDPAFDFLSTRAIDHSLTTQSGTRVYGLPETMIIVENVALFTPAGIVAGAAGSARLPLLRVTRAFMDTTWPQVDLVETPQPFQTYWAIYQMQQFQPWTTVPPPISGTTDALYIAPTPDGAYPIEFLGVIVPQPLSATNSQTFLTTFLPDLFIAASMFFAVGELKKNYGAQADDPRQAVSWQMVYNQLKAEVSILSLRQKAQVDGGSVYPPNPTQPNVAGLQQMAARAAPAAPG